MANSETEHLAPKHPLAEGKTYKSCTHVMKISQGLASLLLEAQRAAAECLAAYYVPHRGGKSFETRWRKLGRFWHQ